MTLNDAVAWSADLGGGTRVALVQAGSFRSDAGAIFGPAPRVLWEKLVAAELDEQHRVLQALNCLLVETPAGRVLVETGVGERLDERGRAWRGLAGEPIVPTLERAGFDPATVDVVAMSHLHYDHAGGLLRADGTRAFARARIVAQRAEWEIALSENPRILASYDQPELRLVRAWGDEGAADGEVELVPGVSVVPTGGHTAGHQAIVVRSPGADPGLLRGHRDAPVVGQPALDLGLRRLPARRGGPQGDALRARCRGALDGGPLPRAAPPGRPPRRRSGPLRLGAARVAPRRTRISEAAPGGVTSARRRLWRLRPAPRALQPARAPRRHRPAPALAPPPAPRPESPNPRPRPRRHCPAPRGDSRTGTRRLLLPLRPVQPIALARRRGGADAPPAWTPGRSIVGCEQQMSGAAQTQTTAEARNGRSAAWPRCFPAP